jgi:acyl-CoA synthetase (NDP forming)
LNIAMRPAALETLAAERRIANIRRLLKPRHVAFVGGSGVVPAIRLCQESGFTGAIWPVNPKHAELAGLRCFPSIATLPEGPDATFIAVPREATIEVVRALDRCGAGGAVCYAAGYAEVGGEGVELQRRLVAAAGELALVGPNCYGLLNFVDGVALWPSWYGGKRVARGAAIVAQSGNIALNLTMSQRSVPLSYVVSAGNQAVLRLSDFVEALSEDPQVSAIGLYIEGLSDVPAFARAAAKALARGVPIVALKAGRSELGAKLAMSHTSSLAGSDRLYDALFRRLGVLRVSSLTSFLETLKLLSVMGVPSGDRLAVFTCSGGDGLMVADRAASLGLALPELSREQQASLRAQLPDFATIANPLDYNTSLWGHQDLLERCFATVMEGGFDAGMLMIDFPEAEGQDRADCRASVRALMEVGRRTGKPAMVTSTIPEAFPAAERDAVIAGGGAPLQGLDEALAAFAMAAEYGRLRRRIDPVQAAATSLPSGEARGPARLLEEWDAKRRLAGFGLQVPAGRTASAADVPAAAEETGFPVVLKLARPMLAHKTEAGAVMLGLGSAEAVRGAVATMRAALRRATPPIEPELFLVEQQVEGAVAELIVGIKRDPQFGLVLVVGAGGVLVEMVEDSATLLLPVRRAEIADAVAGLRLARILCGYRGKPAGDVEAVVDAVMTVAAFAEANRDTLQELDVNPLLVLPRGRGAIAADALVVVSA